MSKKEKFLKTYAIALIFFSACGIYPLVLVYEDRPPEIYEFVTFIGLISSWYLITGLGILLKRRWGYYLFKSFLYLFLFVFPIGTFIAYASLRYMKRNHIKGLFGFKDGTG